MVEVNNNDNLFNLKIKLEEIFKIKLMITSINEQKTSVKLRSNNNEFIKNNDHSLKKMMEKLINSNEYYSCYHIWFDKYLVTIYIDFINIVFTLHNYRAHREEGAAYILFDTYINPYDAKYKILYIDRKEYWLNGKELFPANDQEFKKIVKLKSFL